MSFSTLSPVPPSTVEPSSPLGGRIAFFGRTLDDYAEIFGFSPESLKSSTVLDVASGPASFTIEATLLGARAVAVDPVYRLGLPGLVDRARRDLAEVRGVAASHADRFVDHGADGHAGVFERRSRVAGRFLADYPSGVAAGRYRAGELPELPFASSLFDRVLCGHFLFLYAHRFGREFHLAACRELCRVARGEVRVYPLVDFEGNPVPFLGELCRELERDGIEVRRESLVAPMLRTATERLVLRR